MSIYIDVSSAVHAKAGIGRYAGSLAQALLRQESQRFRLFYNRSHGTLPPAGLEWVPASTVRASYKTWRMAVWAGHVLGLSFNRLVPGVELFHATEHLLPPLRRVPAVLTVHDMIFKLFPEHQKQLNYWYLNAAMPLYCRRANAIITVSTSSKDDIIRHYGVPPDKVTVIHEAAAPEFALIPDRVVDDARRHYGLPERYMIHVGTIEPRKNLARLVEVLARLRDEGLRIPLVAVGGKGWLYEDFFRGLDELDMRDAVHIPGYVPAQDLPLLYNAATLAILPSVYEGFGLPVLEAMACGAPVLSSNTSSLTEVGGDAAHYFDPYDVEAMAAAIRTVWTDAGLQAEMRRRGLKQAARFSWERAAVETMAVYEQVLNG